MKNTHHKILKFIRTKKQPLITGLLLTLVVVGYQNCQQNEDYFKLSTEVSAISSPNTEVLVPTTPVAPEPEPTPEPTPEPEPNPCANGSTADIICNPLGGDKPIVDVPRSGLIASLIEGKYGFGNFEIYLAKGYKHPEQIYFANFNVPPRPFEQGFLFGDNDFLKNRSGDKLIEWFAIFAHGNLTLPKTFDEGSYHIVTISDDGVLVKVDNETLISHPSPHAPFIDCATSLVNLKKGEEKPFELSYYQGPRYHIALMTFIKRVDPTTFKKSSLCGTNNSAKELAKDGYQVMSPEWFKLPEGY